MSRRGRRADRIDYAKLHNTGVREVIAPASASSSSESQSDSDNSADRTLVAAELSEVIEDLSEDFNRFLSFSSSPNNTGVLPANKMSAETQRLLSLGESLHDDITDFIDENPTHDILTIDDAAVFIAKLEELRSKYRNVHKELKRCMTNDEYSEGDYKETLNLVLATIKDNICKAKTIKIGMRNKELDVAWENSQRQVTKEEEEREKKNNSINFLFLDLDRLLHGINSEIAPKKISTDRNVLSDDDLIQLKRQLPSVQQRIDNFSGKYNELLKLVPDRAGERRDALNRLSRSYVELNQNFEKYKEEVAQGIHSREISKERKFQTSSLKIELPKFQGYDSTHDFYTFKDKFEQLHLQDVPERALPELLKNNYLAGPALESAKRLQTMKEIWDNLQKAFGDPRVMLQKKLNELEAIGSLSKVRDAEKTKDALNKVVNTMEDLMRLSSDHGIEERLYHGDSIYTIYRIIGDYRTTKFIETNFDADLSGYDLWKALVSFLERDIKVQLEKSMIYRTLPEKAASTSKDNKQGSQKVHHSSSGDGNANNNLLPKSPPPANPRSVPSSKSKDEKTCHICGKDDHIATKGPYGRKFIQYFACKDFVELSCAQRFAELRKRGFCTQCLFPGASATVGKHADGTCQNTYVCQHASHNSFLTKKHVLVCEEHKEDDNNKTLLEEYRTRCITRRCNEELPDYSKTIQLSHHSSSFTSSQSPPDSEDDPGVGIYMFQEILVNNEKFTIFFDSGCGESVMTIDAIKRLKRNATQVYDGTVTLGGVGGIQVETPYGAYDVSLPLSNGESAIISGLVIDRITEDFPTYILDGVVEKDIRDAYSSSGKDASTLPRLPHSVGGKVDIMMGVQFLRYYPTEVCRTWSGLTMYSSPFKSTDGSRGVVAGPHPSFRSTNDSFYTTTLSMAFFTPQAQSIRDKNNSDEQFLIKNHQTEVSHDMEDEISHDFNNCSCALLSRNRRFFEDVETAGTEITYRCVKCRGCQSCKAGERIESISLKEEVEQEVIDKSVHVDLEKKKTTATLPFMEDPITQLKPNRDEALRVYRSQLKKLSRDPQAKADVISSQNQLQQLGFVDHVKNLTPSQRKKIFDSALQYFIPWRAVWNHNSISTSCRVVFDASMPTKSGKSLNDVLAKGRNQMNKLVEIVLRWFMRRVGFHTDVKKMYNSVSLSEDDWCYQLYLWQDDLDPDSEPEDKVIQTVIYGLKPSGNQSERGLRETARMQKEEYPRACQVATDDVYVDDCPSGEDDTELAHQTANQLETVLSNGGYHLKGFTFSGEPPLEHLTRDGISINVVGMKWYSKEDLIGLDVGELNFASKYRGKKSTAEESKLVPAILTRKHCQGKVSEIFDIAGKITPLTAGMKLDLRDFVDRGISWKDQIPDDLRPIWISHFEMMEEMSTLRYHRTIIPPDAISLDIETIDTGDASKNIACIAIYARVKRKCGDYSCQLVFARSKLLEQGTTQPRAELIAAMLNAHTGEVVKRAFGENHTNAIKIGDSQIALHWINNDQKALKQFVRARVIEILRFTTRDQWFYVESALLIADLGTRRGVKMKDVDMNSDWINGYEWMRKGRSEFPITAVSELVLSGSEKESYLKELFAPYQQDLGFCCWPSQEETDKPGSLVFISNRFNSESIKERYEFSRYIVDPNRHNFSSVVRIVAFIQRFIRYCQLKVKLNNNQITVDEYPGRISKDKLTSSEVRAASQYIMLTDNEISTAKRYFHKKATDEVLHFNKENNYKSISVMKDGILYYTGRILPTQVIKSDSISLTDAMKDLSATSFCVPIVDAHSPIAYSIVNDVHWNHTVANHRGVETVYRYVLKECYIINGRNLVKEYRKNCERCRYLLKRTIDIEMGPVSEQNLTIAPAHYISQVDIAGPFSAYSPHNKRTTVKVYFAVYCCSTTSSVSIKVMEDYSAAAFMQSFIRFSCEVGYPKILVSDEGSQLLKGYEDMRISFTDLRNKLHRHQGVEFDVVPTGGHNMTGKVERMIREIKESVERSCTNQRLSILQWETVGAQIANTINDIPLALGNYASDLEEMDLITPNRLKMGRNNNRSPIGPLFVTDDPSKFFAENTKIFNAWFETWLSCHVPKLMKQPKWFRTEYDVNQGDIVLFLKKEGLLNTTYQYGIVSDVEKSRDGKIRTVTVRYRNHNESVDRETRRAVRQLIVIHRVDELNIIQELGNIASVVDAKKKCDELSATPAGGV